MTTRTDAYRCTITSLDDPQLALVRRQVQIDNAQRRYAEVLGIRPVHPQWGRRRLVVAIKGRLGKNSPHAELYRRGGPLYQFSAQTIRREHAARFDVYVHERWS